MDKPRIPLKIQKDVPTKRAVAEALGWRLFVTLGGIALSILGIFGAVIGAIADVLGGGED